MERLLLALILIASPVFAAETLVTVDGITTPIKVHIESMVVSVPPQCDRKFCDSADTDCDGVLDTVCPGLTYDICEDGSIVASYMDAALTGFCIEEPECSSLSFGGPPDPDCADE